MDSIREANDRHSQAGIYCITDMWVLIHVVDEIETVIGVYQSKETAEETVKVMNVSEKFNMFTITGHFKVLEYSVPFNSSVEAMASILSRSCC